MANNWAFATLAELKQRIGISVSDTTDDDLLTSLLDLAAGMIESAAGRPLRRVHARTEYFTGGSPLIQLDAYPVAKVHSVRESATRTFDTAGAYDELVEGTDFVVDPGPGGQYGETGQLRRIGGNWLGSRLAPGCVRVVYTGGYKTDAEAEAESGTTVISSASDISDFSIRSDGLIVHDNDDYLRCDPGGYGRVPLVRFGLGSAILPTWRIVSVSLSHAAKYVDSPAIYGVYLFKTLDPLRVSSSELLTALGTGSGELLALKEDYTIASSSYVVQTSWTETAGKVAAMQSVATGGHLSFAIPATGGSSAVFDVASSRVSYPAHKPRLTIRHLPGVLDPFDTPDDLRNANLLQATHEYMTRRTPGMVSQATRGTILPSGSSYLKTAADLLPEVERVAIRYRRMF